MYLYQKRSLKELKEGHQEHLLNTKYLRSPIMIVSREELEALEKTTKSTFKGHKGNLASIEKNGLQAK